MRCQGDVRQAFKTAKITVLNPMMCKGLDVSKTRYCVDFL